MNTCASRLFIFACLSLLGLCPASARTDQTITFPPIGTQLTTTPIFMLRATASSGLPVSYQIIAPQNSATLSGNMVKLTGTPGAVTILANQWGNATYAPASAIQDFTVVKTQAGSPPWRSIAYGSGTVFAVKNDGTLWAWGYNGYGSLGDGTNIDRSIPEQIGTDTNWQAVAANYQTVALKTDGTLWTWGYNYYGELGNGSQLNTNLPKQVGTSTWKAIAAGYGFTLAIGTNGTLWEAGNGMGSNTTDTFIQIGTDNHWSSASGSYSHATLVKTDGTLWGMGDNSTGELGIATTGGPYYGTYQSPVRTGTATNWKSASAGQYFTAAVQTNGTLWTWGIDNQYQLGNGQASSSYQTSPAQVGTATNWQSVSAGVVDSVAIKLDGTLWAWGDNQVGETGNGTLTPQPSPEQIGTDTNWQLPAGGAFCTIATKADGTLWTWGDNANNELGQGFRGLVPVDPGLGTLISYATTLDHSVAVQSNGTLWEWGEAAVDGQIVDPPAQVGSATNWATVAAGFGDTLATQINGTLWGWGANQYGQLGDGTNTSRAGPEQIGLATNWKSVSTSSTSTLALRTDGTLWAWGGNYYGVLGLGATSPPYQISSPTRVGAAANWQSVSLGNAVAVAVKSDGTLWTWGQNQSGELGNGTFTASTYPQQVGTDNHWQSASAGGAFVVALKTDGTLWTWGDNTYGELGDYSGSLRALPAQIGSDTTWTKVVASGTSVLATQSDGTLWAWGGNQDGQLGDGTLNQQNQPEQVNVHAKWSLSANNGLGGASTTLATTIDGTLWGWGDDSSSQLAEAGIDNTVPQRTIPAVVPQYLGIHPVTAQIGVPVQVYAYATSALPVILTVSGPATLSGHMVLTVNAPGPVTLMGYQPGDVNWVSTGPVTSPVTVLPSRGGNGAPGG